MAKDIKRHLSHLKSSGGTAPAAADIVYGEIAVGYKENQEALYIKNSAGNVVTFTTAAGAEALAEDYTDKRVITKVTGDSEITVSLSASGDTSGRTLTVTHASGSAQSGFKKLSSDSYGHITGGSNVTLGDLTGLGALSGVTNGTGISVGAKSSGAQSISLATTGTAGTYKQVVVDSYGRVTSGNTADNNTWRPVKVNGTNFLTDTSTALNLSAGTNVTLTTGSTGIVKISATDTKYTAATSVTSIATAKTVGTSANYARQDHVHDISLATGDGVGQVKIAGNNVDVNGFLPSETALTSTSDAKIPTSKAVADYVSQQTASALHYKGTAPATLPTSPKAGDLYVVATAGTYAGQACEVGDYIICRTDNPVVWDVINGENQVENKSASLADAGSSATLATVDGTDITVTTPSTWTGIKKVGTVTSAKISLPTGLSASTTAITSSGTFDIKYSSGYSIPTTAKQSNWDTAYTNNHTHTNKDTLDAITASSTAINSLTGAVGTMAFQNTSSYSSATQVNSALSGKVGTGRKISTASGLTGGGDLTADRTIGLAATGTSGTYGPSADVTGAEGTTIKIPQITTDVYGRVTSVTVRTLTNKNTNYYTSGLTVSTTETSNTITVKGNNSAVTGTAVLSGATTSAAGLMSKDDKTKLNGIATGAEVNQNAYSNIKVGSTTVAAASKTDTVEFSGGTAINIVGTNGTAGNDKITFDLGDVICGDYA